jgi:nucleoside-diphosphate-sugar epimerase
MPNHPVEHIDSRPGDVRRLLADIGRARQAIGYDPAVSLSEGLERTVRWYLESGTVSAA